MNEAVSNSRDAPEPRPLAAIILAAGKGTRMKGDLPKVLHEVAGQPMLSWVVSAAREAGARPIVLVVGPGADLIRSLFSHSDDSLKYVAQPQQLGTANATACAQPILVDFDGDVLVLAGDGPLIRTATIRRLVEHHRDTGAVATLATACIADPEGYGRIIRDADGRFERIVEHASATDQQRAIHEIYPSYGCFDARALFDMLANLQPDQASGECRLTDVPDMLRARGLRVELVDGIPPEDVLSINTPEQLTEVDAILSARLEHNP